MRVMKIGVVGCGNISDVYFQNIAKFDNLEVSAIADLFPERAQEKAEKYGGRAMTVDELVNDPDVDIVLNLTNPSGHYEIDMKALNAGKHVYSEKPLAVNIEQGKEIIETAKQKGLFVGCAPDTVLGARPQTMRKMVEDGWIGRPIAATAFYMNGGMEMWHPNPTPWYKDGGGPVFDIGPYYFTLLVSMFGPAARVSSVTGKGWEQRLVTSQPNAGQKIDVEVPTHASGTIEFANGVIATVIMSFDIVDSTLPRIEIYGTEGVIAMDDPDPYDGPNIYGGVTKFRRREDADWLEYPRKPNIPTPWAEVPSCYGYTENSRSLGLSDMARAIEEGGSYRANGELAYHVLEIMHGFHESSKTGKHYVMQSTCDRPEVMPVNMVEFSMKGQYKNQ